VLGGWGLQVTKVVVLEKMHISAKNGVKIQKFAIEVSKIMSHG
jgi:hypothetical protein